MPHSWSWLPSDCPGIRRVEMSRAASARALGKPQGGRSLLSGNRTWVPAGDLTRAHPWEPAFRDTAALRVFVQQTCPAGCLPGQQLTARLPCGIRGFGS